VTELGSHAELGSPEWSQPSQTSPDHVHMAEMASAFVPEEAVGREVKREREGPGDCGRTHLGTSANLTPLQTEVRTAPVRF